MVGAIGKREIIAHPWVTIHCFGWSVFFRALIARRDQTFLSLLADAGSLRPPAAKEPELVDRCIALELRAKRIYERLARRFEHLDAASEFFTKLSRQEQSHGELLELCRAAVARGRWDERQLGRWRGAVSKLETQMQDAEHSVDAMADLTDALGLVIQIESSEINQVFRAIVAASKADFVKQVRAFHAAGTEHIAFIVSEIPNMAPPLAQQCRQLAVARFEPDVLPREP